MLINVLVTCLVCVVVNNDRCLPHPVHLAPDHASQQGGGQGKRGTPAEPTAESAESTDSAQLGSIPRGCFQDSYQVRGRRELSLTALSPCATDGRCD